MRNAADPPLAVGLGEYVARSDRDLTPELTERARLAALDTIGCMIGAVGTTVGQRVLELTRTRGGAGETTTVGLATGRRVEDSGLANGTLAHLLEFDDGHRPSDNHLGCVVIPAALAMSEEVGATLGQFLEAVVVGYDVMGRVGEATLLPRDSSYFHGTGTTGVFGSAAVAARLLQLDATRTAQALAVAGTAAAGPQETLTTGPDCKPLHAGRAVQGGITSAFLAELGHTGPLTIFEGRHGFCGAMCGNPRPELILDGLGERFSLLECGFKVHSTCGMLFTALDGVLAARSSHSLHEKLPETIRIGAPSWIVEDPPFTRTRPESSGTARFSFPYAVAVAIADGEVTLRQMTPEKLSDPRIAAIEDRVTVDYDEEVEELFRRTREDSFFFYPAAVELDFGSRQVRSVHTSPRGYDPTDPLDREQVIAKFESTVGGLLDPTSQKELVDALLTGEEDAAIDSVTTFLNRVRQDP